MTRFLFSLALLALLALNSGCSEFKWVTPPPAEATEEAIVDSTGEVLADLEEVVEAEDPAEAATELVEEYQDAAEGSLEEEVATEVETIVTTPDADVEQEVGEIINAIDDPEEAAPNADCTIKGNINSKGEAIFHPIDGASWKATIISEDRCINGLCEAWFCTEDDAEAAGFRRALR